MRLGTQQNLTLGCALLAIVANLAFWGVLVYAIAHFALKWW